MFRLPLASALRRAGSMCQPPVLELMRTEAVCTLAKLLRLKLCKRMSPARWKRASFHTILTVLSASLTAMRGKSFIGNRLYLGMTSACRQMKETVLICTGLEHEAVGNVRQNA